MIQDATRFAMDIQTSLSRTLSGTVKPMITQCSMRHLYALPTSHPQKQTLISAAKSMERRRCNHHTLEDPLSTLECLSSVIDPKSSHTDVDLVNRFNYVVAVQDESVRSWCRGVRGVPLVYVRRSVMIMEPMAEGSAKLREGTEKGKFRSGLREKAQSALGKRKRSVDNGDVIREVKPEAAVNEEDRQVKKKIKGVKGPNPLSVKKGKARIISAPGSVAKPLKDVRDKTLPTPDLPERQAGSGLKEHLPTTTGRRKRKHKAKSQASKSV